MITVEDADRLAYGPVGGNHRLHPQARCELDAIDRYHVSRIDHGQTEALRVGCYRNCEVAFGHVLRHKAQDGTWHVQVVEVGGGNPELARQQINEVLLTR